MTMGHFLDKIRRFLKWLGESVPLLHPFLPGWEVPETPSRGKPVQVHLDDHIDEWKEFEKSFVGLPPDEGNDHSSKISASVDIYALGSDNTPTLIESYDEMVELCDEAGENSPLDVLSKAMIGGQVVELFKSADFGEEPSRSVISAWKDTMEGRELIGVDEPEVHLPLAAEFKGSEEDDDES
jgi:hypothetical protein